MSKNVPYGSFCILFANDDARKILALHSCTVRARAPILRVVIRHVQAL